MLNMNYTKYCNENPQQSFHETLQKWLTTVSDQCNHKILIENEFNETTRDGKDVLRVVRLALTSKAFVIISGAEIDCLLQENTDLNVQSSQQFVELYPFKTVQILVFKKSRRRCIKAIFTKTPPRYFEMPPIPKAKIYWGIWCHYFMELKTKETKWPFGPRSDVSTTTSEKQLQTDHVKLYVIKKKPAYERKRWTDKYLYLGSMREAEDQIRPRPMPGLGKTEDIRLLYLKPRYFGCWEQSEHWVQCGESSLEFSYP